jgi:hypothetical protein
VFPSHPENRGTWARHAIKASVTGWRELAPDGNMHLPLDQCPRNDLFRFAFVRHPLEVYRSLWQYKMGAGWDPENVLDRTCGDPDFSTFVLRVVEKYPGVCGSMFEAYVGPPGSEIEFIGRQERLVEDLVTSLRQAGEQFDENTIRNLERANVSDRLRFPAVLTREAREALLWSERETLKRFGYTA